MDMLLLCVVFMAHSLSIKNLYFTWSKQNNFALRIPKWQVETGQKVFCMGAQGKASLPY